LHRFFHRLRQVDARGEVDSQRAFVALHMQGRQLHALGAHLQPGGQPQRQHQALAQSLHGEAADRRQTHGAGGEGWVSGAVGFADQGVKETVLQRNAAASRALGRIVGQRQQVAG